jgi:hypothetical protein
LKRMNKKQLRMIKKRDTEKMLKKWKETRLVRCYSICCCWELSCWSTIKC